MAPANPATPGPVTVKLSDSQLNAIKVAAVADREFLVEKDAIGSIDFDENRARCPGVSPCRIESFGLCKISAMKVKKDQVLFTVESPDFIAAEASLISTAAALDQTGSALIRAKALYASKGIDQNDYETAVANQQSAEGALRAARHAVAIFGKTEAEIDHTVAARQIDTALIVRSPITGCITARNAAPGLFEQPGNPPAPYSVADLSTMWMLANVPEADSPDFKLGQEVRVSVMAFPGRVFTGSIAAIGATVDPNSRRITVRSEIEDPSHELKPQMFATFVIRTGAPVRAPGVPR